MVGAAAVSALWNTTLGAWWTSIRSHGGFDDFTSAYSSFRCMWYFLNGFVDSLEQEIRMRVKTRSRSTLWASRVLFWRFPPSIFLIVWFQLNGELNRLGWWFMQCRERVEREWVNVQEGWIDRYWKPPTLIRTWNVSNVSPIISHRTEPWFNSLTWTSLAHQDLCKLPKWQLHLSVAPHIRGDTGP